MRKRKRIYSSRPVERRITKESIIATVLGIVALVGYIIMIVKSYLTGGTSGPWMGLLGWIFLGTSIYGISISLKSFQDFASETSWKFAGLITNGIACFFSVVIFILGIF